MNLWTFLTKKVKVKFLEYVPRFIGIDEEEYGPFEKGEIAEIPEDNAKLLIEKGYAEKFKS